MSRVHSVALFGFAVAAFSQFSAFSQDVQQDVQFGPGETVVTVDRGAPVLRIQGVNATRGAICGIIVDAGGCDARIDKLSIGPDYGDWDANDNRNSSSQEDGEVDNILERPSSRAVIDCQGDGFGDEASQEEIGPGRDVPDGAKLEITISFALPIEDKCVMSLWFSNGRAQIVAPQNKEITIEFDQVVFVPTRIMLSNEVSVRSTNASSNTLVGFEAIGEYLIMGNVKCNDKPCSYVLESDIAPGAWVTLDLMLGRHDRDVEILITPLVRNFVRGQMPGNSAHGIDDAIAMLNGLFFGGDLLCQDAIDVDDDGFMSLTDPVYLLVYLFRSGPAPPSLDCDCDFTPDDLGCAADGCVNA